MKTRTNPRLVTQDDDDLPRVGGSETNRARFKRIANDRVAKALDAIQYCEKLSNTAVYEAYPGEPDMIIEKIQDAVDRLKFVLKNPGKAPPVLPFADEK